MNTHSRLFMVLCTVADPGIQLWVFKFFFHPNKEVHWSTRIENFRNNNKSQKTIFIYKEIYIFKSKDNSFVYFFTKEINPKIIHLLFLNQQSSSLLMWSCTELYISLNSNISYTCTSQRMKFQIETLD